MSNSKVTIIGAGNVGAQAAMRILERDLADIVLLDIQTDLACAKALDLMDAGAISGYKSKITGTSDYALTENSEVVVITAGFTRRPGMSREELLEKNVRVTSKVISQVKKFSPQTILIMVTNPLDILTHLALKLSGFPVSRVMGMAGILDCARFSVQAANSLNVSSGEVDSAILGSHSDKMLILSRLSRYNKQLLDKLLKSEELNLAKEKARNRGAEIVELLKGGSAFFAPSAGILKMVEAIVRDKHEIMPVSCYLNGHYGLKDITLGTLARIGKEGIEEIIELDLTKEEKEFLHKTAEEMRSSLHKLGFV